MHIEYKVVPAPTRGLKAKGLKTAETRFCNALETLMNTMAADGWDYLRADTLPSEERQGLTGSQTVYRSVLVFQRAIIEDPIDPEHTAVTPASLTPEPVDETVENTTATADDDTKDQSGA